MTKMKLLFLDFEIPYLLNDSNYPVGGACVRQYAFAEGLTANGHEVGMLTWKGANNFVINYNYPFTFVESYKINKGIKILRWLYYRIPSLLNAIKKYKPDFIFQKCAGSMTGLFALMSKILRIPFIYLVANDIDVDGRFVNSTDILQRLFYTYGLYKANGIICQNDYQYGKLKEKYPQKKIIKILNPYIDMNPVGYESLNIPKEKREYFAWIGIFQHQKNLPALLKIAQLNSKLSFKIAGKSLSNIDIDSKNAIVELKKLSNVEFVGYLKRSEVRLFLSNAYALINTSYYEGFSNTFLEAFSVGTPIASLYVNPDGIFTNSKLGYVVNPLETKRLFNLLINEYDYISSGKYIINYLNKKHNFRKQSEMITTFITGLLN